MLVKILKHKSKPTINKKKKTATILTEV